MRIRSACVGVVVGLVLVLAVTRPALAQVDLSGQWQGNFFEDQPERAAGPEIGDYTGLPINAAARMRAEAWDASLLTLPEHQCKPHPSTYGAWGPNAMRIQYEYESDTQALRAIHIDIQILEQYRTVWMDGRPHPPDYAAHTWQGFSTGHFEGDVLVIETSHIKAGWLRRNGIMHSDRATMVERYVRHGNILTRMSIVSDPQYFTEPFVRTINWTFNPRQVFQPYPCLDVEEIAGRAPGYVPHHLPGQNDQLEE